MKIDKQNYDIDSVIEMAWCDKTSFDSIKAQTGIPEKDIIKIMRSNLKKTSTEKIEQLNFLNDNKIILKSIKLKHDFSSINTIDDYRKVKLVFKLNRIQKKISKIYKIIN